MEINNTDMHLMDFGPEGKEFIELIKEHCSKLTEIIHRNIKHASRHSLKDVISLSVLQGYLNGCIDVTTAGSDKNNEYLTKLKLLLFPVSIMLTGKVRDIERKDGKKPDSSK